MISIERFLQLPTQEVAAEVRTAGPKVCVFPVNGTRRWFVLEHEDTIGENFFEVYMQASIRNHIELCSMLFEHGIEFLLAPVFGRELLHRGDEYTERVGMEGLRQTATHNAYRQFFEEYEVRVRFYGDYGELLAGTSYEDVLQSLQEVTKATQHNQQYRLFFGVFADQPTDTISRLAVEHYLAEGSIPDRQSLIRKYYGEAVPSVSLFIGFDKFSVFDMPLLQTGTEDLYFSVSPSPYMTQNQLRAILYDHLYVRTTPEPDYSSLEQEERTWLREFYRGHEDMALGVGTRRSRVWVPEGLGAG